eukprot:TRINITY_DN10257_c0_g1_i2.p1 TRINITY_DN10257_c0_g1~~TRINITY_DN10257_c0_g1_i2.p1  ORF type:complete len:127 (+),score=5.61 TRINITY_DN10257_c0_g1_i2:229-609(+)
MHSKISGNQVGFHCRRLLIPSNRPYTILSYDRAFALASEVSFTGALMAASVQCTSPSSTSSSSEEALPLSQRLVGLVRRKRSRYSITAAAGPTGFVLALPAPHSSSTLLSSSCGRVSSPVHRGGCF